VDNAVFDTKRHSNVKANAEYLRIGKYYKGLDKFKAEKHRRKRLLELQNQGLPIKQIAMQLRVSERTVKRDLAKIMVYVKKKRTQLLHSESDAALERFNAMSLKEQLRYVSELEEQKRRVYKTRRCSSLLITIDLDAALSGNYAMSFKPKLPLDMLENGRITIELIAHGKKQAISRIYVGKVVWGSVNLQTNQSMNTVTPYTLKGLQITESADFGDQ
jgi:hypothetical protein